MLSSALDEIDREYSAPIAMREGAPYADTLVPTLVLMPYAK
jgi:hypothetical protein